jgi:dihydrofolate synthase/folylpolyglutamate synthase
MVVATQSIHPRAMDTNLIVQTAHEFGTPARSILPLESALAEAVRLAGEEAAVVATGSLFVAAAVRDTWMKKHHSQIAAGIHP